MAQAMRLISFCYAIILTCNPAIAGNNAGGAFSNWPDTGQTTCYDAVGNVLVPCPAADQPFHGQDSQYHGPERSYTKLDANGNDLSDSAISWLMVRDNVTGLIWEVKQAQDNIQDYTNPHDADNTYTWCDINLETNGGDQGVCGTHDTVDFIDALNNTAFGGYSYWRLPTIKELSSLADNGMINASVLDTHYFSDNYTGWTNPWYWTSTTWSLDNLRDNAWSVEFSWGGNVGGHLKSTSYHVRAVRGGQPVSSNHFLRNGDGTVTDTFTGLTWQQNSADSDRDGIPDIMDWQEALSYCEHLTLANSYDWRLPNVKELHSLVDYTQNNPAINTSFFPDTSSSYYQTSTSGECTSCSWHVEFINGLVDGSSKSTEHSVRCVRSGLTNSSFIIPPGTIPPVAPSPTTTEFGELTAMGPEHFNENQDCYVISHGWNPSGDTALPLWEIAMAHDLKNKSGVSGGNVLMWNWQEKAKSDHAYNPISGGNLLSDSSLVQMILGVPYDNVRDSGKYLAKAIRTYLHDQGAGNYVGSIHMIGHSLGSGVIIQAALRLTDDHDSHVNYNVRQLTLLDSPWYVFAPSVHQIKLRDFFIDNYYTLLGRPQGYGFADVNVWIDNHYSKLVGFLNFDQLSNGHQLAHQWYRSSITNFQDSSIIGFDDSAPISTKHYGYYWHDGHHQDDAPPNMFHYFGDPYWKLRKGVLQTTGEYITDTAGILSEIKQETKDALRNFAISSAINVTIVAAETLNKLEGTVNYITDAAGHALWVYNTSTANGYLKLILNSDALLSVPISIPAEATSMQFNYEFLTGSNPQTRLEVYINDALIFTELAEDVLGTGEQFSGWMNVKSYAGKQVDMTYRLSNPDDGPLGAIAIDDIIFAKLSSLSMKINTGFPWPMFLPAITGVTSQK